MAEEQLKVEQTDNTLTLTKLFDAPKELVFSMFKNPEHLEKWWGPETWPATIARFEFVPGGVWHYFMTGPDGTKAWGKATFKEINEPDSFSYVDVFSDEEGNVDETLPQGITRVTFEEHEGKTLLRMSVEYKTAEEIAKLVEMGMVEGIKDTWSQLESLIAAQKTS
jgi:uncharacterized protein YndB with AHSA1/START domain